MANDSLVDIFDTCVERLAQGDTITECVQSYPDYADELRVMLEATQIPRRAFAPNDEVRLSQGRVAIRFEQALREPNIIQRPFPIQRVASFLLLLLFIGSLLTTGAVAVAQDSLPGDALYPLKRLTEGVQLAIADDKEQLEMQFAERRIQETKRVLELQREVNVQFVGIIEKLDNTSMRVADLDIVFMDALPSITLMEGMRVQVFARTQRNQVLLAQDILILDLPQPIIHPSMTPTIATETHTPTATATTQPTSTPTLIRTESSSPRSTKTPTSTVRPSATPADTQAPQATESSSASSDCEPSIPAGWVRYTIQPGDTPSALAVGTDLPLDEFFAVNCHLDPRLIVVGEMIALPYAPRFAPTATEFRPVPTREATAQPIQNTQPARPTNVPTEEPSRQRQRDNNDGDGGDSRGR